METAGGVHGFPAVLTSFVGRAGPVREMAGLLDQCRLVTVTGPGGAGKTRLAGEVARRVAGRFADGAWLAELAPVRDPAQVAGVVAAALGVREQPGVPVVDAVARVLARQQLLLVLDNCEHVIGAAARLCAGLLGACDDVRVLATSREPLAVAGEVRYRLGPLGLPGLGDPAEAAGSEAVELFADRARQADPHFILGSESGPVVAQLVTRLDGMPLAIELAAARAETLGVAQLLDRLDDRLVLLTAGDRLEAGPAPVPGRDGGVELSAAGGARAAGVPRLVGVPGAVHAGGRRGRRGGGRRCGGAASGGLLAGCPAAGRAGWPVPVRACWRRCALTGLGCWPGPGERNEAAAAQAGYALEVAEQAAAALPTAEGELAAGQWLDAEDAMLRQVLAWAMDHDTAVALRLAVALAPWWDQHGGLPDQYPLLRRASGFAEVGSDGWCAAEFWLGMTVRSSADMAGALGHFTAVRDAVQDRGPSRVLTDALIGRTSVLRELGRVAEAVEDAHSALALAREIGYPAGEVLALVSLSHAAVIDDDVSRSVRLAREAGQITADIPSWADQARCITLIGVLTAVGDLATAEAICAAGLARCRTVNSLQSLAILLDRMAILDFEAGRVQDGAAHLREALQILVQSGGWFELINSLDGCGRLCAATGRCAEAVTLWSAYAALCRQTETADWPADARLRQRLLAQGTAGAWGRPDPHGRGAGRGDDPGHRS